MKTTWPFIFCCLLLWACNTSSNTQNEEVVETPVEAEAPEISEESVQTETDEQLPPVAENTTKPKTSPKVDTKTEKEGVTLRGSRDEGEAKKIFERAEKYEFGDGVKKDISKAIELYRQAAEMDFPQAQYNLAFLLNDEKESLEWLTKSAENGYKDAQYELAIQYLYGYGVRQDMNKSVYWFEESAKNGHKIGQYKLGLMYDTGEGVRQNLSKAAQLYKQSADQGVGIAQFNLAMMYITGEGVDTVNMEMAAFWMDKARTAGVKDAKKAWNKFHLDQFN